MMHATLARRRLTRSHRNPSKQRSAKSGARPDTKCTLTPTLQLALVATPKSSDQKGGGWWWVVVHGGGVVGVVGVGVVGVGKGLKRLQ